MVICQICSNYFDEPVECLNCHNNFCQNCIDEIKEVTSICPYCRASIKYQKNTQLQLILDQIEVVCSICNERIKGIKNYKKHGKYKSFKCLICELTFNEKEFLEHINDNEHMKIIIFKFDKKNQNKQIQKEIKIENTFNNKYKKIEIIGKGGFGTIYKVKDIKTNNFYALKLITIVKNDKEKKKEYEKEILIMKNIKNKYIIELIDYFYEENEGYCIVMELCDGNLRDILNKFKPKGLPLNIINKIFIQLNEALKAMINKEFIHRDLKPENILIKYTDTNKTNFDIKLTDFGFSTNEIKSSIHTYSIAGTPNYIAPEVETYHYNNKCDLWSLGIILYELYTNKYIFDSFKPLEREIKRHKGEIARETDNKLINKLIRKLIQVDIKKRIGWEEYFNDDFFKRKEKKIKKNNQK